MNPQAPGSAGEVLHVFLRLGLTSFGGPIAHIGYFREEFVVRRRWLEDASFTDLVALCQFLPGPASSQMAFALGLARAGGCGAAAACAGFTLPSVALMVLLAWGAHFFGGSLGAGVLHGLKLVAVAVVAQAVLGMARSLAPDGPRAAIALGGALLALLGATAVHQVLAVVLGGCAGFLLYRGLEVPAEAGALSFSTVSPRAAMVCLVSFAVLLLAGPLAVRAWDAPAIALFVAFYHSGALVFGGGHVVLPFLQSAVVAPGWVSQDAFLAGYAAAQALPGPLFSVAAYLGWVATPVPGALGGLLGLTGIYLPGLLVLDGALPFWDVFRGRAWAQGAMRGVNAAVVGLLGAALYSPLWTTSVQGRVDFAVALVYFVLLVAWKSPPILVVTLGAVAGLARAFIG